MTPYKRKNTYLDELNELLYEAGNDKDEVNLESLYIGLSFLNLNCIQSGRAISGGVDVW